MILLTGARKEVPLILRNPPYGFPERTVEDDSVRPCLVIVERGLGSGVRAIGFRV